VAETALPAATEIQVDKIEAARRQLKTAVWLYFVGADPLSVHTLAAAARQVLEDANTHRGGKPMLVSGKVLELLKPELHGAFQRIFRSSANFLKHAKKDPDDVLRFRPEETEFLLVEACLTYWELSGRKEPEFMAFQAWYMFQFPEAVVAAEVSEQARDFGRLFGNNRRAFFREAIKAYREMLFPKSPDAEELTDSDSKSGTDTHTDT